MGIMIAYHGYNNPAWNAHKNVCARYTQQNTVFDHFRQEACTGVVSVGWRTLDEFGNYSGRRQTGHWGERRRL